ncbi:MAG TPA: nucleotidyltransferase domain-containing protein, partial [Candidatus Acidoferrales bacterium]|nr:nucleotidyltransferase domain-containing protein [Candidatus Acidoferrales bacterium]
MDGSIDPAEDYVKDLSAKTGRTWPALAAARDAANEVRGILSGSLAEAFGDYATQDVDVIAFGSLARQEWTSGSDVDWTLLIDGQATPDHRRMAREIAGRIGATTFRGKELPHPGAEGIFGSMAFSHEIIHHIGGQADSILTRHSEFSCSWRRAQFGRRDTRRSWALT